MDRKPPTNWSRRGFIGAAAAAGLVVAGCGREPRPAGVAAAAPPHRTPTPTPAPRGPYQPGILEPAQAQLQFAAFDVDRDDPADLRELLVRWTATAGAAMAATPGLTITFGFGASLFRRFGLQDARPDALAPLPAFRSDDLEAGRSGGDLCAQICADDAPAAWNALHALGRDAAGIARPRWIQSGFGRPPGSTETPRNTLGFKDGSRNLDVHDPAMLAEHVWSAGNPEWMRDGTYLVARRIRTLLDVWDATTVAHQEASIGRHRDTGAPLGKRGEHDDPDFNAMPPDSHVRLAAPEANGGARLLRRGFNYSDGVDPHTGQIDAGLFFICFQRDPQRQFVRIQQRLDRADALNRHLVHTGSAVFACPAAARPRGFVGETLLS